MKGDVVELGPDVGMPLDETVCYGFSLRLEVTSPISLVFPKTVLLHYELLFRTLCCLHHSVYLVVRKQLCEDLFGEERSTLESMLHTLNAYISHCSMNIIPVEWNLFMEKVSKSVSLEELLTHQSIFFARVFDKCLLSDIDFTNLLRDVVSIIAKYSTDEMTCEEAIHQWTGLCSSLDKLMLKLNDDGNYAQLRERLSSRYF